MNTNGKMSRRQFLLASCGTIVVFTCSACLVKQDKENSEPESEATAAPAATPATESAGEATATPALEPTDAPVATAAPTRVTTQCPRGMVNDPYPGRCHHYTDLNGNGMCDLSEPAA